MSDAGAAGAALAAAAEALVGSPFRLHGRDPATGIDCVGVLALALARCGGRALPGGYAMKMHDIAEFTARAAEFGFAPADGSIWPGDVLITRPGVCQYHFVIAALGGGFVHAHAGLRRVVLAPTLPDWPREGCWRLINAP